MRNKSGQRPRRIMRVVSVWQINMLLALLSAVVGFALFFVLSFSYGAAEGTVLQKALSCLLVICSVLFHVFILCEVFKVTKTFRCPLKKWQKILFIFLSYFYEGITVFAIWLIIPIVR